MKIGEKVKSVKTGINYIVKDIMSYYDALGNVQYLIKIDTNTTWYAQNRFVSNSIEKDQIKNEIKELIERL